MNWYRAKTILIIFFICMNAFLLANLIYSTQKLNVITSEIIDSTVEVLSKSDIQINPDIIPKKTVLMKSFEMKNVFSDKMSFAKFFCGDDTVLTEDNKTYTGTKGKIFFEGDKFSFTPVSADNLKIEKSENAAKNLLSGFNIDTSSAEYTMESEGENTVITLKNKINDYKIFDSYIKIITNANGGINIIEGVWFVGNSKSDGTISLKSVTGVLVDFILHPQRPEGKNTITHLELGYTASDYNIYHESTVLVPVWEITLSDGSSYCIDTRE